MIDKMRLGLLVSAAILVPAAPAFGQQDTASTDGLSRNEAGTEDIIVTAQRKDTSLSRTPVSIDVLSADTLADAQIFTEADLRLAVPGLSVRAGTNSNQLNYSIRGNSQDAFSGTRPGVLPYINEVQIGGSGGSTAFYDLESIQVLKGPQGTLFGRSATGGAVLFTTAKPKPEFGGYASGLVGDHGAVKVEGAINAPLVPETLLLRVAGFYSERHGFQYNLFNSEREGDGKRHGIRGSLTANPGPSVQNELMVDYYHARGGSMLATLSGLLPLGAPGNPPYVPATLLYAGTSTPADRATGIATLAAFTGVPQNVAAQFYDAYFSDPKHPATGLLGEFAAQQARGPFVVNASAENVYDTDNVIVSNATTIELGPDTAIKNIFGYARLMEIFSLESDGVPYALGETGRVKDEAYHTLTEQISNELQLQGKAAAGRLDYVAGFYFSREKFTSLSKSAFFDILFGGSLSVDHYRLTNTTLAGYAQATYALNDSGLSATVGARYTSEKVRKQKLAGDDDIVMPNPLFDLDRSETFNRLSWNLGLQYQASSDLFLYAASRRAYKSGGFVGTSPSIAGFGDVGGDQFRAEKVSDAEAGAKYLGNPGGMPTRLSAAVYYQWIENSQRTAYTLLASGGPAAVTVNVPKGRAYGFELDGSISPASWLTLGGSANYINSKFGSAPAVANGQNQVFDQVPDTPKCTGIAYADVTLPVSGSLNAILHGDVYAQTKAFISPRSQNNVGTVVSGYAVTNFRIGVEDEDAGWSLMANLKNAFDRTYFVGGLPAGEIYQINVLIPGEPRTFTVEARIKF